MNKGLLFEWCIYYLVHSGNTQRPADYNLAKQNYKSAPDDVKEGAKNAIVAVESKFGKIKSVAKISGGDEPKTDLIFKTARKAKVKCSLKFGEKIQLSSGGVSSTAKFLLKVLTDLRSDGYNSKKLSEVIKAIIEFESEFGGLGKMPRTEADKKMKKAERYDALLKQILGSRQNPNVKDEYEIIKLAIVREAMTGRKTFSNGDKSAEYVLTENDIKKIDDNLVKKIASTTSVRLALKGRGKQGSVRLNEVVVRFDTE